MAKPPRTASDELAPGLYEHPLTARLIRLIESLPPGLRAEVADLRAHEAPHLLSRQVANVLLGVLRALVRSDEEDERKSAGLVSRGAGWAASLLQDLEGLAGDLARPEEQLSQPPRVLREVASNDPLRARPERPLIPLGQSALLVNERGEPSLARSLEKELTSADRVDLLCAFIQWNGLRLVQSSLQEFVRRGGELRVLTSTYMGVTQRRAVDALCELGAEVRVAYDREPARTRLHAKAWLFHRHSGLSTAYIGSSNLSHSALVDGLEWNVRLSAVETPEVIHRVATAFDRYWHDPTFEPYDPLRDGTRLDAAVRADTDPEGQGATVFFDVRPYPHQQIILEQLERERSLFGRRRNLVVAATGTGKTLVAAFDYERLREEGVDTLLFIAHREEILRQARHQYRNVLRDGGFGELWGGGERPTRWRHVFASVQSLDAAGDVLPFPADHFDLVVLDEMHHAPAPSYDRLLDFLRPAVLLGLTATPERSDGLDALKHFDGRISAELRLWDALDLQLLAPFHYFGVPDDLDLSGLQWQLGAYVDSELEALYLGAEGRSRVAKILTAIERHVDDSGRMRALGFCVGVRHAEFMARCFEEAGLAARAVTGKSSPEERRGAVRALRDGKVRILFTADLFNEGVDIPEVDTLLFLRPTESATLFLQQLGRGLRNCPGKRCVTVLDFIGIQHRKFRFDARYRALTGLSRRQLEEQIQSGFEELPPACDICLERAAQEVVLQSIREAVTATRTASLTRELQSIGDVSLPDFLHETGLDPGDLYRNGRTLTQLRRRAGLLPAENPEGEDATGRGLERLLDQEDPHWFAFCREGLQRPDPPEPGALSAKELRLWRMLLSTVCEQGLADDPDPTLGLLHLWELHALRGELGELLALLRESAQTATRPFEVADWADVPLRLHGTYSRNTVATAFGLAKPSAMREGVRWWPEHRTDTFFVTFRKTEDTYSPTTRYDDYVVSPAEVHWESQSTTTAASPTGRRYRTHAEEGSHVLLFAREQKVRDGRTVPYVCLGPATYACHESERPMRIRWRLHHPMPEQVYERFRAASG